MGGVFFARICLLKDQAFHSGRPSVYGRYEVVVEIIENYNAEFHDTRSGEC
jgi:hypothetical protein